MLAPDFCQNLQAIDAGHVGVDVVYRSSNP
jgi:hypothetical protein